MLEPLPLYSALSIIRDAEIDAVELPGEPGALARSDLVPTLSLHGVRVSGFTAIARLPTGRDLAHPDEAVRRETIRHFTHCVELARRVDAPFVAVAPSAIGRHWLEVAPDAEWRWAVEGLARLAEVGDRHGVTIAVEILNRYATPTVHTVDIALRMINDAGGGPLGIVLDLFHAALEESSIPAAIRAAGPRLTNVQVADNTREAPGRGALDFEAIAQALRDIDYDGPLALEAFPPGCGAFPSVGDDQLPACIEYVREMRPFFMALGIGSAASGRTP